MEFKPNGEGRKQEAQEERQREREMRRLRGEISCSECRRCVYSEFSLFLDGSA